jgi:hypothetical protein
MQKITAPTDNYSFLLISSLIWFGGFLVTLGFLWFELGQEIFGNYYLIPWCLITGLVVLAPVFYYLHRQRFDLFNPLVFGSLSYIFPAFVLGGVILSLGLSDPFYLAFIEDPKTELPLSLVYVAVGYVGLILGFSLPLARKLAEKIDEKLPKVDWEPSNVILGGLILVIAGFGINILGFLRGILGYQRVENVEIFDGLLIFLQILLTEGIVLLWMAFFQQKRKTILFYFLAVFLISIIPLRMTLLGSRSALLLSLLPIAMAFFYSGKRLKPSHWVIIASLMLAAAFIGAIYGTAFRNIKGSEVRIEAGEYVSQALETLEYLRKEDPVLVLKDGGLALAERVENLSSLAVVVSNYEKLAPYEEAYGLENNIINDLLYTFIPRFIYPEKPKTSDARAYSDLYFNYGDNSFTITPFGDLLRNFGPIGIPLGMFFVGFYLRLIYSTLIDTKYPTMWKKVAYYPLLTVVSYESFYATIFPSAIRTLIVASISLYIVHLSTKIFIGNNR